MNYRDSICRRITQIDRGIFRWGVIHARKPVRLHIACEPPVPFKKTNHLILSDTEDTNIVVVDIMKKFTKDAVAALPPTVELLITLSAGLDHIDVEACRARGIVVKQSGRDAITSHVAQYTLGFLILGLRDALHQLGVSFPATGWNLNWNCEGKALTSATIAIVGLGLIAKTLVEEVRKLAPDARIIYHVPKAMRDFEAENKFNIEYIHTLPQLASQCDVLLPLCPLTKHTDHLIGKDVIANLKPHAGIINVSRGKVVDTDALTEALENKLIKYAILNTTFPEPLPADHRLWKVKNCFIFPHYATNTMDVREALVSEIQPIIEDHYGLGHSDARRKAQEKALRFDLAVAHRLTAKYDMDMLVWNHISSRFRMGFLITPGRKMWGNITPEDLVYSSSNVTADDP
jgi:glyoxylate/hydroxypyruvate reductase